MADKAMRICSLISSMMVWH